jgi:hypothetical protein
MENNQEKKTDTANNVIRRVSLAELQQKVDNLKVKVHQLKMNALPPCERMDIENILR